MAKRKTVESRVNYEKRVKWFRDAGLGMFIHWGAYSALGHGDWAQWREDIHPLDYVRLAEKFNPKKFDAEAWAQLAKEGGAKYVVFTTRHHDGFSLWDSKVSDYNSVKMVANRDFVAEYVKAVRSAGLKVGLYYSLVDWSWPAFNMNLPARDPLAWKKFAEKGPYYDIRAWRRFRTYVHRQVGELMANYGKIDLLFYDGNGQTPQQWKSKELNAMVRKLQPHIIINNRAAVKEDYDTPENVVPSNIQQQRRPWESCMCMNDSWGYIPGDSNFKSVQQCLCTLIRIRAGGGNLLLNTNPNGDGSMPPQCVKVFRELGSWLANNGESIYGCQLARMAPHCAGFFSQPGLITARPDKHVVYYHILRWLGRNEHCAKISAKITSARLLLDGTQVKFRQKGHMVYFLDLPKNAPDKLDTVIKINYAAGTERLFYKKNMFIT